MAPPATDLERSLDRRASVARYRANRRHTADLFDVVAPEAYGARPIELRNPIVFYEGHLPAFSVNTLLKKGLGRPGIDPRFEVLFERGIDPEDESALLGTPSWPSREAIRAYGRAADDAIVAAPKHDFPRRPPRPFRRARGRNDSRARADAPGTLLYIWHRLPYEQKRAARGTPRPVLGWEPPERRRVRVPAGRATLGAKRGEIPFGWDNEFEELAVDVPEFEMDVHDVTNRDYLEFVRAGGYDREDLWSEEGWRWRTEHGWTSRLWERRNGEFRWRGMFEERPLPPAWPVFVRHARRRRYAGWRDSRLPTSPEFHRAAYGTQSGAERAFPWGDEPPDPSARELRLRDLGSGPRRRVPRRSQRVGLHDSWARLGVDVHGLAPFPARADAVVSRCTPPTSSTASTS